MIIFIHKLLGALDYFYNNVPDKLHLPILELHMHFLKLAMFKCTMFSHDVITLTYICTHPQQWQKYVDPYLPLTDRCKRQ